MPHTAIGAAGSKKGEKKRPFVTLTSPESQTLNVGRRREQVALTANKRLSENSVFAPLHRGVISFGDGIDSCPPFSHS